MGQNINGQIEARLKQALWKIIVREGCFYEA